jgi:hypothetical protein
MANETLIVALEALLVFGGAVAFAIWQLRSIKVDQAKAAKAREAEESQQSKAAEKAE